MDAVPHSDTSLLFGPFELRPARKLLLENGQPVRLGSRALGLLCVLTERAGQIVSRDDLVASVWPSTLVEETSLRVHISALRKALGEGRNGARFITNVPGRGYAFVAPVARRDHVPAASAREPLTHRRPALPPRLTRAIGRSAVIAALTQQIKRHRLVSIVGPGGMGKTTVALEIAESCQGEYVDGAFFVDLAPLASSSQVPSALGTALGVHLAEEDSWADLIEALRARRALIVLDNCEHVIDVAAALAERLLRNCPQVDILATSREALDAEGEWVHRLAALSAPTIDEALSAAAAMSYSAVQLFVERAMANSDTFSLTDENIGVVQKLCVQLDGMPLAIELAAGRIDTFGLHGLASRLSDLFRGLMTGRRTALPRHRTLRALLEWSHDLLSADERIVLRRLSVFRAGFTIDSAVAVVADQALPADAAVHCIVGLAAKSLVTTEPNGQAMQHRLLFTTREYATSKLTESGELDVIRRRHAIHFREMTRSRSQEYTPQSNFPTVAWFRPIVDDIRASLDWCFSPDGDEAIGIALTYETLELRFCQGTLEEIQRHVDLALDRVSHLDPPRPDLELRLISGWYHLSGHTPTRSSRQARIHDRILALCEQSTDAECCIEALHALLVGAFGQGHYHQIKPVLRRLRPLAVGRWEPLQVLLCDRFLSMADHFLGNHHAAKLLFDKVACFEAKSKDHWYFAIVPRSVSIRIYRSRIHWIEGQPDRAMTLAMEAVELGVGNHPFALAQALGMAAIPIALWRGDDAVAHGLIDRLLEHIKAHGLVYWRSFCENFKRALALRSPDRPAHGNSIQQTWQISDNPMERDLVATLSESLVTEQAVARVNAGLVGWCSPEVIRADACRRLAAGTIADDEARNLLERAMLLAREQGALAWELRVVTSLVRLRRCSWDPAESTRLLSNVLDRFEEGLDTADLVSARAVIDEQVRSREPERRQLG
jgi:predicted ATPase/DNA-binding winged helix-turn-helix (wHTH) protein